MAEGAPPDTTDPTTIGDKTVCLATEALVAYSLSKIPEVSQSLPEGWDKSPQTIALEGILSGDVTLSLSLTTISAVGGVGFSESDPSVSVADGGRPQRASRKELAGY